MRNTLHAAAAAACTVLFVMPSAQAQERCAVAWSHYVGWEPLGYIEDSGMADRWGERFGVDLSFTLVNDYIESVNLYTSGAFDGVSVTNMDGLTIPAVGGIDTEVIVVGDFSNGNDGILIHGEDGLTVEDLAGKRVALVELSVSHYLLARALGEHGLSERDLTVINASDADIGSMIATSAADDAFVTWNPILLTGRQVPGIQLVFDSSQIPGEIVDTIMVNAEASDGCKRAITGAWYEAMTVMSGFGAEADEMLDVLAAQSGGTVAEYRAQLETTRMFFDPAEAAEFAASDVIKTTMQFVAEFSFDHGLYGTAPDAEFVGVAYPDGSVWGNPDNVRLHFTDTYMRLAADGAL
ncbi:MAG: ABC transporter substrate-binding protein [Rhodospirillaceae bacterium]|nr:ABC transporter substrate-binding protein [Rhodospirillaceae bacterium]